MDKDMILPDDFQEAPPQAEGTPVETHETGTEGLDTEAIGEDTKPPVEGEEVNQEPVQPQKLKIKFNHEEKELDFDEAAALAQKGMNYEKAIERAKQEAAQEAAQKARDQLIADMGYNWNGKPITTEAEYKQAKAEQEMIDRYKDRDIPDEVIKELIESRRFRDELQREKAAKEEESQRQTAINEFFAVFEELNERAFDPKKDSIPAEVQEAVNKGQSLTTAYTKYHAKELRNQLKIAKQNQENTRKAPVGSVTAGGGAKAESEDPFLKGFDSITY